MKHLSTKIDLLDDFNNVFSKSINENLMIPSVEMVGAFEEINKILNTIIEKSSNLESEIELNKDEKKFLDFVETITKATSKIEDLKKADAALK